MSQPQVWEFTDADSWEAWLAEHHGDRPEAWLRIGRKHTTLPLIRILDAALVGLCYGWIDGQRRSLDDDSFVQRYSPRRSTSSWSQVNVERVQQLIGEGRMRPPGMLEVERARADGRWDAAYERQATAEPPADLLAALAQRPVAAAAFERLSKTDRYALMLPLLKARTTSARSRAVATAIDRLDRHR